MLIHVVLFRPKADLESTQAEALVDALEAAANEIPCVRRFRVGRRVEGGPAYPASGPGEFAFAAFVEVDDRDGLETYLSHPVHAALGQAFNGGLAAALIADYDVRDVGDGIRWFVLDRQG
jgi:hypothetical protein